MTPQMIFPYIVILVIACWLIALISNIPPIAKRMRFPLGTVFFMLGWLLVVGYMVWMWVALERPPMRTQGETRLLYVIMLPILSLVIQWRWKNSILTFVSTFLAVVPGTAFLIINMAHPDLFDKTLMPALQSPWFVPHVAVYIIGYAAVGFAALFGLAALVMDAVKYHEGRAVATEIAQLLVIIGFPLLTTGLIFGALWAKVAWGTYWSWDPKETWAFLTWAIYLIYIHLKTYVRLTPRMLSVLLVVAFMIVLGCWFGVNKLPTAQQSVHTYTEMN